MRNESVNSSHHCDNGFNGIFECDVPMKYYEYLKTIDRVLKQGTLDDHTKLFMIKSIILNFNLEEDYENGRHIGEEQSIEAKQS